MGFAQESGYVPATIETIMLSIMANINTQFGTTYTYETFIGTNLYKYFYALAQELQRNDVKTAEIFQKLQDYFALTNERIARPVLTNPGLLGVFESEGYVASIKKPIDAEAGKLFLCVDLKDNHARGYITITGYANLVTGTADTVTIGATVFTAQSGAATLGTATFRAATSNDATATSLAAQINAHATAGALVKASAIGAVVYLRRIAPGTAGNSFVLNYTNNDANVGATKSGTTLTGGTELDDGESDYDVLKLDVATIIMNSSAAGVVSQGAEVQSIAIPNGQPFDFKFDLPTRLSVLLKLTIDTSDNNQLVIGNPDDIKNTLITNIFARYRLGRDFEPQRYFSIVDAPWAAEVKLEYSLNGGSSWLSTVYQSEYNELFDVKLENITLVET